MKQLLSALMLIALLFVSCQKDDKLLPVPQVTTADVSNILYTNAKSGGTITSDGGASVISRGVCWSIHPSPTINDDKTSDGAGGGSFASSISHLSPNTSYFVRAYASSTNGTGYGLTLSFTTNAFSLPELTTTTVSGITATTALSGGTISTDGGSPIQARGLCWSTTTAPTISGNKTNDGNGIGNFVSSILGLTPGTTYYLRAYATNIVGTTYGNEITFKAYSLSILTTSPVSRITLTTVIVGGNIVSADEAASLFKGVCWSTNPNPTIADNKTTGLQGGLGTFQTTLTGLSSGATYHLKAYVTNSVGTAYGNEVTFTTTSFVSGPTDIDGNVYTSITIGTQVWMAKNLQTTKYSNGDVISNVTDATQWSALSTGAWSFYNNSSANNDPYGKLYNWYAVVDSRNVCPSGWHIPSYNEWLVLESYLGGTGGGSDLKMKEAGFSHWPNPNSGATNESGFTGIPGGKRFNQGAFEGIGSYGNWWSTTVSTSLVNFAESYSLHSQNGWSSTLNYTMGVSVRCLKD